MNKVILYLKTLTLEDYQKMLAYFLPPSFINKRILEKFIENTHLKAKTLKHDKFLDPHEWLEKQVQDFCTVDPHEGCLNQTAP